MTHDFDYFYHSNAVSNMPAGSAEQWGWLFAQRFNRGLENKQQVIITSHILEAKSIYQILMTHCLDPSGIHLLADWETLPYDTVSVQHDITAQRYRCWDAIINQQARIIVVAVQTMMYLMPQTDFVKKHVWHLKKDDCYSRQHLLSRLADIGYHQVNSVSEQGSFSCRGAIIDIYPMGFDKPFRLDYFDNVIEQIYLLNPEDLSTIKSVKHIECFPKHECIVDSATFSTLHQRWNELKSIAPPITWVNNLEKKRLLSGYQYFLPALHSQCTDFFSYISSEWVFALVGDVTKAYQYAYNVLQQRFESREKESFLDPQHITLHPQQFKVKLNQYQCRRQSQSNVFAEINEDTLPSLQKNYPHDRFVIYCQNKSGLILASQSIGQNSNNILTDGQPLQCHHLKDAFTFLLGTEIAPFRIPAWQITVISQRNLYNRYRAKSRTTTTLVNKLTIDLLHPGQLIIHQLYGLGRFLGLIRECTNNITTEFLQIEYAKSSMISLNVERIDLINLYHGPLRELDSLGKKKWRQRVAKAQKDIDLLANQLLDQQQKRFRTKAIPCKKTEEYYIFCHQFMFDPTECQLSCFQAVEDDMGKQNAMDRLVCGDVGFGKTEIAMRSACLAVQNSLQVIVLAPTTILAEQHMQSFRDRFAGHPINIGLLSRRVSTTKLNTLIAQINEGKIDIVVATHLGTRESIKFKNLGLIIIDEEHRFGVAIKQHWIKFYPHAHRLLLSATPIPRTLNQAFAKMCDINMMVSPPVGRQSIKTSISPYHKELLHEAVSRELNRGGQVYVVCNDIAACHEWKKDVQHLDPSISVAIGHGQMNTHALELIMHDFKANKYQVLVATTIIESGIDIPNANTIVIIDAHLFGLAQLHQLRGRVGRSSQQAYAYMFVCDPKYATPQALARLEAIASHDNLGQGAQLAIQDLEIRGAGHILGKQQSGHVDAIGLSLYCKLLSQKTSHIANETQVHCQLDIDAYLCSDCLPDSNERLNLYQKIFHAPSISEIHILQQHFMERFGVLPQATENLFVLESLKRLMQEKGINSVRQDGKAITMDVAETVSIDHAQLVAALQKPSNGLNLINKSSFRITVTDSPLTAVKECIDTICT